MIRFLPVNTVSFEFLSRNCGISSRHCPPGAWSITISLHPGRSSAGTILFCQLAGLLQLPLPVKRKTGELTGSSRMFSESGVLHIPFASLNCSRMILFPVVRHPISISLLSSITFCGVGLCTTILPALSLLNQYLHPVIVLLPPAIESDLKKNWLMVVAHCPMVSPMRRCKLCRPCVRFRLRSGRMCKRWKICSSLYA